MDTEKKTILFHLVTLWEFIESSLTQEFKPTLTTVASMVSQSDKRVQRKSISNYGKLLEIS
jgi:hypothetical protein